MSTLRYLAVALALGCLALFSYCTFPGALWTLWAYAVGALLLWPGLRIDQWPVWKAWLFSLGGVGLGVLVRYLVEYGEHSWSRIFTVENILLYLILTPVYIVLLFHGLRWLEVFRQKHGNN